MTRFLMILPVLTLGLTACGTPEQNAVAGGLGGAVLGAAVSNDDDRLTGALTGAAVGVGASLLLGPAPTPGQCYYRNSAGQRVIAAC
jgi:Glycine zipper 2TM domain